MVDEVALGVGEVEVFVGLADAAEVATEVGVADAVVFAGVGLADAVVFAGVGLADAVVFAGVGLADAVVFAGVGESFGAGDRDGPGVGG